MKSYSKISCIILLSVLVSKSLYSQQNVNDFLFDNLVEKVYVITDRDVYCVNENIQFSVLTGVDKNTVKNDWSKIIYIELISPDGVSFVQQKYKFNKDGALGDIYIPNSLLTGNYYLRCYTKWMRNYQPQNFFYKAIKIINPYSKDLLSGDTNINVLMDTLMYANSVPNLNIDISDSVFNQRDKVNVLFENLNKKEAYNLTVSVTKLNTHSTVLQSISKSSNMFTAKFIPETSGVSLTGKLVDKSTGIGIKDEFINLTIFSDVPKSLSTISGKNGDFYFALPDLNGQVELFLTTSAQKNGVDPDILVDNDFYSKTIKLPFIPFTMNEDEEKILNELSVNSQIESSYQLTKLVDNSKIIDNYSFYGQPDFILNIDDFIPLASLQDYFRELIPNVNVVTHKKNRKLKVSGEFSDLTIYDPLVLIDFVAISDIDAVLKVAPSKISRIEVVQYPYIKGDVTFGGVINIISKKGDFGGVNLPATGKFFKYNMLTTSSVGHDNKVSDKRIPNLQNTLFWEPKFELLPKEIKQVDFFTGDTKGKYEVVVTIFDEYSGDIKMVRKIFTVK